MREEMKQEKEEEGKEGEGGKEEEQGRVEWFRDSRCKWQQDPQHAASQP